MDRFKKIFAAGVIFVTVLSMSVAAGPVKAAAKAGDLIKINGSSTVYYLGSDGKRYIFPNEATYFSWYKDFSGVVTVSQSELENYPRGAVITIRPGTKLIKTPDERTVYAVEPGGTLRSIVSESNAIALWGADWAKRVVDVIPAFMVAYKTGSPLAVGVLPAGSLVKTSSSADVYYFDGTSYRKFASEAALTGNGFQMANVITVSTVGAAGSAINGAESALTDVAGGAGGSIGAGSGLTVALSASTAPSATVLIGQAAADLASFNFTAANDGDVKVTSVKLKRIGISSDATLSNVYLYDGNIRLTDAAAPSSGVINFNAGSGIFTVAKGTTKTISVKADIAGNSGNTVGVAVNAASDVVTDGAAVSGAFPANGNIMSTAQPDSSTLGTATMGTVTSVGASVNAGTNQTVVWSAPVTIGVKASNLKNLSLAMIGTISNDALANITMFVNGVQAGSATTLDTNARANFDISNSPVKLDVGANTVEVRADVVKGSSRSFKFQLQNASDMVLTETGYGVNILAAGTAPFQPSHANATAGTGFTTISSGTISISQDSTFSATTAVKGAAGVEIARFTMKAYGEDMKVMTLDVKPFAYGATSTEGLSNVSLFVNGQQVGSSKNYLFGTTTDTLTFGTTNLFTILAGQSVTLSVKADLTQVANSNMTLARADLVMRAGSTQGVTSVSSYPSTDSTTTGQAGITITTGALSVSKSVSLGDKNVLANTPNTKIGSFVLSAGSAEGVKVSNIAISLASSTANLNEIANVYISDNPQPVVAQNTMNFPVNFQIAANGTHNVDVFADINNVITGSTTRADITVTAYGVTTNKSVGNATAVTGQTITVQVGTLAAPTLVSNAAQSALVVGGSSLLAGEFKFVATNGDATLKELTVNVTDGTATGTPNGSAIASLTVNGVTQPVVYDSVNSVYKAYLTGLGITVPAGTQGKAIDVTANYNNVTSAGQGGSATRNWNRLNLVKYKYTIGNTTTETNCNVASNPTLLVAAAPVVDKAADSPASVGSGWAAGGDTEVLRFTVTTGANQTVNLNTVGFKPAYVGSLSSTTQLVKIYDKNNMTVSLGSGQIGTSGTQGTIAFTSDYTVNPSTSAEFVLKADTTGLTSTGNSFRIDLTDSATASTDTNTGWAWNDATVSAGTYGNGYLVKNLTVTGPTFTR